MINLRNQLNIILKSIHPRVYYQVAPDNAVFPYLVYDLPNSFTNEEQDIFNLDVDIWDNNIDTTALEVLTSSIWKEFNKYRYINDNIQFSIYRMSRLALNEENRTIRRRKLIFNLKYFDRRLNNG